jgi:hypothetical protein
MTVMSLLSIFDTESASNAGAELTLLHPVTKEPVEFKGKPITIRLLGPDSDVYTKHIQSKAREARRNAAKGKKEADLDFEKLKREASELYAAMTIGWDNMPGDDGKQLEFSRDAAVKLYITYKDIRTQVGDFIGSSENFIGS